MRLLVAPVALLFALSVVPPAAADPSQSVAFTLLPGLTQSYEVTIPSHGPVWIEIFILRGSTTDLSIGGPGSCGDVTATPEPASPPANPPPMRVDCGIVLPMNSELSIGVLTGAVRGYMVLHGLHVTGE